MLHTYGVAPCNHILSSLCGCPPAVLGPAHFDHIPDGDPRLDGWFSALTGAGTAEHDKRLSYGFQGQALPYEKVADLWERDDIAAKAIEAPTTEAFREGYALSIPDESRYDGLKEDVEDELERLGVDKAIERAYQYHRAYGGSAIYIGVKDGRRIDQPLDMKRGNYEIECLTVFEPIEIEPAAMYQDPFKPKYGEPQWYRLTGQRSISANDGPKTTAPPSLPPLTYIHESRLIVFSGIRTSNFYLPRSQDINQYWGAGIMPRFIEALRDCGISYAGAGLLATDISQPVISIEGLKEMVGKSEEKLRARMKAIEMSRSIARAILIDASKEKYERQTTNLAGIPDLLDRLSQRLAAAVDIPLSVLFGYSPASLGTPDNKELELWYNKVRNIQRRELTPPIRRLVEAIMRSLRQRKIPKKWELVWKDLEHRTISQKTEDGLTQSRTDSLNIKSGMLFPNEARMSRWKGGYSHETQIDEKKKAPGFMAPLPAGVLPGSTPAAGVISALEAKQTGIGAPAAQGPNAHSVQGYARKNPTAPALGANPKVGGDSAPGNRDRLDGAYTAANEAARHRRAANRLRATGGPTANAEMFDQLAAYADGEAAACAGGTCGPDCTYEHPERVDANVPGKRADEDGVGLTRSFAGFSIVIENPRGSTRSWTDSTGQTGTTTMSWDYGYLPGSLAADGDSVDVYLGPDESAGWVYCVHQMSKASDFRSYDEDKVMLAFPSPDAARAAYLAQYNDPRFFGGMSMMSVEEFRSKVYAGTGIVAHGDDELEREVDEHLARKK